eukprot:11981036-Alexandrium_andersonii.AAC.1
MINLLYLLCLRAGRTRRSAPCATKPDARTAPRGKSSPPEAGRSCFGHPSGRPQAAPARCAQRALHVAPRARVAEGRRPRRMRASR